MLLKFLLGSEVVAVTAGLLPAVGGPGVEPGVALPADHLQYSTVQYSTVQYSVARPHLHHAAPEPGVVHAALHARLQQDMSTLELSMYLRDV